jgi:hypothetical protein
MTMRIELPGCILRSQRNKLEQETEHRLFTTDAVQASVWCSAALAKSRVLGGAGAVGLGRLQRTAPGREQVLRAAGAVLAHSCGLADER